MKPSPLAYLTFLPSSFPPGTTFFNVEGVAVSVNPERTDATAWDPAPRRVSLSALTRGWPPISEADFRALVKTLSETG